MEKTLNQHLNQARVERRAIGHFNFAMADVLRSIVEAAKESGAPCVVVGTSHGEADFLGLDEAVALVAAARRHFRYPVFLNADHFRTFDQCKAAIDAGYDSVIIHPEKRPEENIEITTRVVRYARSVDPRISVEGELGYLKGTSEVQERIEVSAADYTQPEEVKSFVAATGVDRLAVVFGNIHGIVTQQEEHLDIGHFKRLIEAYSNIHYVLHGASGLPDEEVRAAVQEGIVNVHFNTELRVAYEQKLKEVLTAHPTETTPYKFLDPARQALKEVVVKKLNLFKQKP